MTVVSVSSVVDPSVEMKLVVRNILSWFWRWYLDELGSIDE